METSIEEKALLLRTLGHPVRLRIAVGLAGRCACVREIWECLEMPQAVVSQHLKVMKENGILEARREGARVCYSLKSRDMADLVAVLGLPTDLGRRLLDPVDPATTLPPGNPG
ncbi:MAG TPA: metalloregulator ArsR/SmtB family transcription factor [Geobacteraceae bacterium]|nr:metalloregulator ArsR/SmtB family transcription factor [Geobacteraceae bacterium]